MISKNAKQNQIRLKDKDPQLTYKQEMQQLNLKEVSHPDTLSDTRSSILNDLRISLETM